MSNSVSYLGVALAVAASLVVGPALAGGDPLAGEQIFKRCAGCHSVIEGPAKLGPHLRNVIGRPVASVVGFRYSKAMQESGVIWTERTLDQFIQSPNKFMRRNEMPFGGMRDAQQRADLIAYLREATAR